MAVIDNGMPAEAAGDVVWVKANVSNAQGSCVELAALPDGRFAVRNSRHPQGPALVYTRSEIVAFVNGAKMGDFDRMIA